MSTTTGTTPTPELSSYSYVPETKEDLPWADLPTIDLSNLADPEEARKQGQALIEALNTKGFFYITGFDISPERVSKQFALGESLFNLPLEERMRYHCKLAEGDQNGYRSAGRGTLDSDWKLKDRTEAYNIPKFNGMFPRVHPPLVQDNLAEIESFARDLHAKVLDPLLVMISRALELPSDYLSKMHNYEQRSEDHLRWMKYGKFTPEENDHINLWNSGHTDLGTLTLLFRQPVAGLQIRDNLTGEWRYAKPLDKSITANACDMLSYLTGGYIKSTIHRVKPPPRDQQHVDRIGVLYFSRPLNHIQLKAIKESPLLNRLGYTKNELEVYAEEHEGVEVPDVAEFTKRKQQWQLSGDKYRNGVEFLPGVKGIIHK
ncbi:hypothetical protein IAT38_001743 [Cryptococcus sp. DSM 104549]